MDSSLLLRILDISRGMAEVRAFAPLLDYVVEQAIQLVGAERGYIVLPRADGSLDFRVTRDRQGNAVPHAEDQISTSVLRKIMDTGEPLVLRDAMADPQFSAARSVMALNLRSVMGAPLMSYGKAIGAIYVENRSVRNRFKEEDLPPLVIFAHQAAAAIENAALNDDLEARVAARTQELQTTNAQLEQSCSQAAEANRLRTLLLSKVVHDLRSPLALAQTALELVETAELGPLNADQLLWIGKSRLAIERAVDLTRDVFDLSKLELGGLQLYPQPVALPGFLHQVYDLATGLRWPAAVTFQIELAPDLPAVCIDPSRIEQVLFNFLTNAIKFTAQGSVTLHAQYAAEKGEVVIGVADTGEGILPEQIGRLFERFQQVDFNPLRRSAGTGLGLAICRELVEMHGGRIWVDSAPGAGSDFKFALPVAKPVTASGCRSIAQVEASCAAADLRLTAEEVAFLAGRDSVGGKA